MGRTRSQMRSALAAARAAREATRSTRSTPARAAKSKAQAASAAAAASESEYDESEEEEMEPAPAPRRIQRKKTKKEEEEDAVAEYERKRLANIQRNLEFMKSMGVSTAKMAARTAVAARAEPSREQLEALKAKRAQRLEAPRRKSRRLEGKDAEQLQVWQAEDTPEKTEPVRKPPRILRGLFMATAVNTSEEHGKRFLDSLVEGHDRESEEDLEVDTTGAEGVVAYELEERDVIKALPDRVYSMALHPRADRMIVAAGDKLGNLALWSAPPPGASLSDDSQEPDVVVYRPHQFPITQLHFSPQDATKLLTSGFDGCVREFDLRGGVFSELFASSDSTGVTSLALAGGDHVGVYYASCDDGTVCRLDRREAPTKPAASFFTLHEKKINTVHCHPTRSFSIVTASLDRTVCLWDARKLRVQGSTPVLTLPHFRSVNCAYFSPTGAHLVTVGQDNFVNIFSALDDKHEDPHEVQPSIKIPHNNMTGRWLTKLHASWDPKRPDQFVIGCLMQPRRLQIFRATHKNPLQELTSDLFNSVHSINVFHPHADAIVGGNSSGRLCLWRASRSSRRRKSEVIDLT